MTKILRRRIEMQGFTNLSDSELNEVRPWIKLASALCLLSVGVGMVTQSTVVFAILIPIAALGTILPWHPFDFICTMGVRRWIQGPFIPRYRAPRKIACCVATAWLWGILWAFLSDRTITANVLAGMFILTASLPVIFDLCTPSYIYHWVRSRVANNPFQST